MTIIFYSGLMYGREMKASNQDFQFSTASPRMKKVRWQIFTQSMVDNWPSGGPQWLGNIWICTGYTITGQCQIGRQQERLNNLCGKCRWKIHNLQMLCFVTKATGYAWARLAMESYLEVQSSCYSSLLLMVAAKEACLTLENLQKSNYS